MLCIFIFYQVGTYMMCRSWNIEALQTYAVSKDSISQCVDRCWQCYFCQIITIKEYFKY